MMIDRSLNVTGNFRFRVLVDNVYTAIFTECSLPNLQVETLEIKEGGQNSFMHKLPVRVNVGTVTLKHGLTQNEQLMEWYLLVLQGKIAQATREVSVILHEIGGTQLAVWSFRNAYPIKWVGPKLKTDDSAVAIQELELVHHGFEVG